MLGRKKKTQFAKGGHTLFDHALVIDGSVRFAGTLDIEGTVNGDIVAEEGADALVRIRDKGCVNGELRAPKVIINGQVNGDVFADQHLELAAKAEVNGNVHYQVIEMVKGAHVNGGLVHITEAEPSKVESSAKVAELKVSSDAGAVQESKSQ
ncbi:polymer-forming cytoskeletal protein [Agaribacterium sp. ZY112]|uniref:bactofilin family protein n=1 Tax=Agaribacterium sp. ZY112 TaxID=3233574 RepID=UPI0035253F06